MVCGTTGSASSGV
jgi:hypothetical protein